MRGVFLTFSGPLGRMQNAYEMWSFSGAEVLEGVLRGWFANGGGPAELVRLDEPDDLPAALEAMPDADVVCFPGLAEPGMNEDAQYWLDAQRQVVAECERRGSIAVLDSPPGRDPRQARVWRTHVLAIDSPNAVLYYPWIRAGDGWVPPCGHVAGAWARVARDEGVCASVGGIELIDVVDVATDVAPDEQWVLQQVGVSVLRALPGWGIRTAGARTLSSEAWLFRASTVRLLAALKSAVTRLRGSIEYSVDLEEAIAHEIRSLSGQPDGAFSVRCEPLISDRWRIHVNLDGRITKGYPLTLVLDHPEGTWSVTGTEPEQDGQPQDH
ncbi:phage tail sheath subtilisin-like domain-containing protein [Lentzea sp. NPDC054927]